MRTNQRYGVKFPFSTTQNNLVDLNLTEKQEIKTKISLLITTKKRSWIRKPNYGLNLNEYLFKPLNDGTVRDIKNAVIDIIKSNINNLEITNIDVNVDEKNLLFGLNISYLINSFIKEKDNVQITF